MATRLCRWVRLHLKSALSKVVVFVLSKCRAIDFFSPRLCVDAHAAGSMQQAAIALLHRATAILCCTSAQGYLCRAKP